MKKLDVTKIINDVFFDVNNLKKETFFLLLIIWIIIVIIFSALSFSLNAKYNENKNRIGLQKKAKVSKTDGAEYDKLLNKLINPEKLDYYNSLLTRDIFSETKVPVVIEIAPVFEIRSIERLPLSFMYKGFIETPDGSLLAQFNWDGSTKFVRTGDKIKGFKILEITKQAVLIQTPENLKISLKNNKVALGGDYQIVFFDSANKKTYTLKKNELLIGKYKVIDINDDSVILLKDNEKITLKKGEKLNG